MLILGPNAGKKEVARFLVLEYGFTVVSIGPEPSPDSAPSREALPSGELVFESPKALLGFVTAGWGKNFVVTDVSCLGDELEGFLRRPFFLLISVDAPTGIRWARCLQKLFSPSLPSPLSRELGTWVLIGLAWCFRYKEIGQKPPSLEDFVGGSDSRIYRRGGAATLAGRASVKILNAAETLAALHEGLRELNLTDESRLRPGWDSYFMQLASLAAQRSNCMKRRVGCVLVREKRVISTGYNGTPRGLKNCNEGGCGRCNSGTGGGVGLSTCLCIHAEENALLEAGRERVGGGSTLYCDT